MPPRQHQCGTNQNTLGQHSLQLQLSCQGDTGTKYPGTPLAQSTLGLPGSHLPGSSHSAKGPPAWSTPGTPGPCCLSSSHPTKESPEHSRSPGLHRILSAVTLTGHPLHRVLQDTLAHQALALVNLPWLALNTSRHTSL